MFAITETWLTVNDKAICKEITPPGYNFTHCPRSDRTGGGIALLFKDHLKVRCTANGEKTSFEFAEHIVDLGCRRIKLVIVYRPPYSPNHTVTKNTFIAEISDYFESIVLSKEFLCITEDFSIHIDDSNDVISNKFNYILESMCLTQHLDKQTHEDGHILDLIITQDTDDLIYGTPYLDRFISDHCPIVCGLKANAPPLMPKNVTFRKLKSINIDAFKEDICKSDLAQYINDADIDKFVSKFNNTLRTIRDSHAPVKTKSIINRPYAPWIYEEIRNAKRQRRKAERTWRASKLPSDLHVFKAKRNFVAFLMNKARHKYYSEFIEKNSKDQSKLYKASKSVLNLKKNLPLPPCVDELKLANDVGAFFIRKICDIRSKLDDREHQPVEEYNTQNKSTDVRFSKFSILFEIEVNKMILDSNKKSCALDPVPTTLLIKCLDELVPSLTRMINLSLESGHFPTVWRNVGFTSTKERDT